MVGRTFFKTKKSMSGWKCLLTRKLLRHVAYRTTYCCGNMKGPHIYDETWSDLIRPIDTQPSICRTCRAPLSAGRIRWQQRTAWILHEVYFPHPPEDKKGQREDQLHRMIECFFMFHIIASTATVLQPNIFLSATVCIVGTLVLW